MARQTGKQGQESITLTPEELKKILRQFDADGNGVLSQSELRRAFAELNSRWPGYRVYRGVRAADADGDGAVSIHNSELDDLVNYMGPLGYKVDPKKKLNSFSNARRAY